MGPDNKKLPRPLRLTAATACLALSLGACAGLPEGRRGERLGAAEKQQLDSSLKVASASADAGQLEAAERLYSQLSRHYPDAPEPRLGLGYLALQAGDFALAGKLFAEADERATAPAAKAEALLGAGRTSLGTGDIAAAKRRLLAASKLAEGTAAEAWVANGLGVVATLEGDHARARMLYDRALELSPSHPMITANLVRSLAQSGATGEAREFYARYAASHWLDGDKADLSRLLKTAKGAVAASASGAQVQLYSARSRDGAVAAWSHLSSEEKDLLGSLEHRVVKVEIPKRGTFYRLWAGPLADKTAARRLCGQLKARGRDCFVRAEKWAGGAGPAGEEGSAGAAPSAPLAPAAPVVDAASPGALVQLHSARSRDGALAAWSLLSSGEEDLLGSLEHRVVRAEIPKRGVFYRLWAGPLADKAAARRLCGQLKARGRDCLVRAGKWPAAGAPGATPPNGAE